ncbi:biotin transporter BioY [Oceanitalea stevensii]|uniref:Biotin transporter n=1 Tax=Oceanitalea stevensii TaxID=2763072 RepID=A0ABR8YXS3_9MICO|nr:biotin transporter BioY [Oceanitalea stevensii]MBD8060873.1 biotin transporter BioY [Oceanitalea stevensii]
MTTTTPAAVLADSLPAGLVRDASLVAGGAVVTGVLSQVVLPLPFTPVPLSLGTFAVLLVGASLGPVRGTLSMLLYLVAGVAGVPWFAEQSAGWHTASFGYVIGYVLAAGIVGALARRRADRSPLSMAGAAVLATLAVYAGGVPWLMVSLGVGLGEALVLGVLPFLLGDVLKAAAAAGLLPAAWRLLRRKG